MVMNSQEKKHFLQLQKYDFITPQSKNILKIELEIGLETVWNSIVLWSGARHGAAAVHGQRVERLVVLLRCLIHANILWTSGSSSWNM